MKLSGHSYDNDVFNSLLDGIKDDIEYKGKQQKTASNQASISGIDIFSSTTEQDLQNVQSEELRLIASELEFAADKAKVAISRDHLYAFAKNAIKEGLKGKSLERAAQKFCSRLASVNTPPQSAMRNTYSSNLLDNASNHAVVPAGYDPNVGPNDSKTGGYLGMSKNPNTIWDSEAMQRLASQTTPDEQMKANKEAAEQFKKEQKNKYWEQIQAQLSQENVIHEKSASVANISTKESSGNATLPVNAMSILSDDRDFSNIPEKTPGETLRETSEARANKKQAAKEEWNQVKAATKADNTLNTLFNTSKEKVAKEIRREKVDELFERLIDGSQE